MTGLWRGLRENVGGLTQAWDRFWFSPVDPAPLCAIRLLTGFLLFWTHLVWSLDLNGFFGPEGWVSGDLNEAMHRGRYSFSLFSYLTASWQLWSFHIVNLIVFFMLMIGLFSRFAAVWSYFAAINYAIYVTPGAFFGLDKINCLLVMYVMLGPCGARYSVDRLLRERRGDIDPPANSIWTNISLRLIQLHLCVIYLFSGLGKLQGDRWWDGTATWFAVANVEYRSLDMTWMANHLWLSELLTHVTVFWELFYIAAIWVPLLRPWMLLIAVGVHGNIALTMGMPEFAAAMLLANGAFLSAGWWQAVLNPVARRLGGMLGGAG